MNPVVPIITTRSVAAGNKVSDQKEILVYAYRDDSTELPGLLESMGWSSLKYHSLVKKRTVALTETYGS